MLIAIDRRSDILLGQVCPAVATGPGLVCLLHQGGYMIVPESCVRIEKLP